MKHVLPYEWARKWRTVLSKPCCNEALRSIVRQFFVYHEPDKWLFIVGCYNSGTTITRRLLEAHQEVQSLPREGVLLTSELPRPEQFGWTRMWLKCRNQIAFSADATEPSAQKIKRDWSPWFHRSKPVYLEKSIANLLRIDWLDNHFKNAHFLGIVRNGYCSVEGLRRKAKPAAQHRDRVGPEYPVELVARQWREANRILARKNQQMENMRLMKYEDLVAGPLETIRTISSFLDLKPPSMGRTRDGIRIDGGEIPFRTGTNEKSFRNLTEEEMQEATPVLKPLLREFGYDVLSGLPADRTS